MKVNDLAHMACRRNCGPERARLTTRSLTRVTEPRNLRSRLSLFLPSATGMPADCRVPQTMRCPVPNTAGRNNDFRSERKIPQTVRILDHRMDMPIERVD